MKNIYSLKIQDKFSTEEILCLAAIARNYEFLDIQYYHPEIKITPINQEDVIYIDELEIIPTFNPINYSAQAHELASDLRFTVHHSHILSTIRMCSDNFDELKDLIISDEIEIRVLSYDFKERYRKTNTAIVYLAAEIGLARMNKLFKDLKNR